MLYSQHLPHPLSIHTDDAHRFNAHHTHDNLLSSVLENIELAIVIIHSTGEALYMNGNARCVFQSDVGVLPTWTDSHVRKIIARIGQGDSQVIEHWTSGELTLRVRARPHRLDSRLLVLEVSIAHASGGRQIAENLARALRLSFSDAQLLALLWRGMTNTEISEHLRVRVGTVKSRLFRLYQRLGIKRRPAAVLRAAEVLGR